MGFEYSQSRRIFKFHHCIAVHWFKRDWGFAGPGKHVVSIKANISINLFIYRYPQTSIELKYGTFCQNNKVRVQSLSFIF